MNSANARTRRLLGLCLTLATGFSSATVIKDATNFETEARARYGDGSLRLESFDSALPGQYKTGTPSLRLDNLTLYSSRFSVVDETHYLSAGAGHAINAVPGGWGLGDAGWTSEFNSYSSVRFVFDRPIQFFGLDVYDLGTSTGQSLLRASLDGSAAFDLLLQGAPWGSAPCDPAVSGYGCHNNVYLSTSLFAGFFSDKAFRSIELTLIEGESVKPGGFVKDDYVGFDNLRYGYAVPAPATFGLVGLGLLLLVGGVGGPWRSPT
ncbi:hypothetical protein [Thiocystis violascens]|uniref:PEP-CTERM exosortase interaction domain-containing protein n=1 Tax=Thiocystis violascens (strain ATCC 17096 / DSM 198 / 6111) TaxID=765911 RepID=I3YD69_THIV6|nr:hypothetical protein [Thiocystis violascens]AFL74937.1 hypothetical protein Thivi_3057 [Thiocystis violascens DSM 198]